jgi:hypothetical protein
MLSHWRGTSLLLAGLGVIQVSMSAPQPSNSSFEIAFPNDLLGKRAIGLLVTCWLLYDLISFTLEGTQSTWTEAILILDNTVSNQEAALTCTALHESLVDPDNQSSSSRLGTILSQRVQTGSQNSTQLYWVSSANGFCRAINAAGMVVTVSCYEELPALCTQSAPFSNSIYADNSVNWQTKVQVGNQTITGYRDRAGFRFLGVRYAEQPERFTYSQVFNKPGSQSAISYGSTCIQAFNLGGTEDCLFLNIFTTYLPQINVQPVASQLKPVMFYIHGGGLMLGSGSQSELDGGNLASRGDVVVITINYRLGAFGFLALNDGSTNGNFGLSDQITALD